MTTNTRKHPRAIWHLQRVLRHYFTSLCFYSYALPFLLLYHGDVPRHPCAHWRDGVGTGWPRRRHPTLYFLSKGPMVTSMTAHSDWGRYGEQGHCLELPPRRWSLTCDGGCVPVSHSESRANQLASELKELPTETVEMSVQPKKARAEPTACAPMIRWCTAMAHPHRGRQGCCKAMTEVRGVLRRVILGW